MKFLKLFLVCFLVLNLIGCEAFVRKFTRKSKKDEAKQELPVIVPEEYKEALDKDELYVKYYEYWKSWQEELIQSLLDHKSQKKKLECVEQSLQNLEKLKSFLKEEKRQVADRYIIRLGVLREQIDDDTYGRNDADYRQRAEHLKLSIQRELCHDKIKGFML